MKPATTILNEREMLDIDQASRALLWEVGTLAENEEAMDYFEAAGAVVDRTAKIVRIPDHVINETLSKCSSSVRLYHRDNDTPMIIGGDHIYYGTVGIATNVLDFETNDYRQVICDDLRDIVRLSDVLNPPDFILVPATPTDVPSDIVDLIETKILLTNTRKHFIAEAQNRKNCLKIIENGCGSGRQSGSIAEKPFFSTLVTLSSPLHFRDDGVELIVECAKHGLPLFIESGPMCGGTSPATLASTLVMANAELLSSFVLAKAVNPSVPLIYASWHGFWT